MAFLPALYTVVIFASPLGYFLLNVKTREYFISVLTRYGFIGRLTYSLLLLIAFLLARFLLFEFLFVIRKGLIDFYALGDLQISLIIIFAEFSFVSLLSRIKLFTEELVLARLTLLYVAECFWLVIVSIVLGLILVSY